MKEISNIDEQHIAYMNVVIRKEIFVDTALTSSNDVEIHMPDVNLKLCCMGFFFEKFKASFKIYQLNFCNYE